MSQFQPGIFNALPPHARYLTFQLRPRAALTEALAELSKRQWGAELVVGIGPTTAERAGAKIAGLTEPPRICGRGISIPATPAALWCWLRGTDRGTLLHQGRSIVELLQPAFALDTTLDAFVFDGGRDLTGYEDGTENPHGEKALETAFVQADSNLAGSSFVAVQKWIHDLSLFQSFPPAERDDIIGRRQTDNEELDDAPESSHVKRTAQESFDPEAFMLRRSMPFTEGQISGLNFVAFGNSFDAFEAQLRRMAGLDDGIHDALFRFSRPISTSYFWCPPLTSDGQLDLTALGL